MFCLEPSIYTLTYSVTFNDRSFQEIGSQQCLHSFLLVLHYFFPGVEGGMQFISRKLSTCEYILQRRNRPYMKSPPPFFPIGLISMKMLMLLLLLIICKITHIRTGQNYSHNRCPNTRVAAQSRMGILAKWLKRVQPTSAVTPKWSIEKKIGSVAERRHLQTKDKKNTLS